MTVGVGEGEHALDLSGGLAADKLHHLVNVEERYEGCLSVGSE